MIFFKERMDPMPRKAASSSTENQKSKQKEKNKVQDEPMEKRFELNVLNPKFQMDKLDKRFEILQIYSPEQNKYFPISRISNADSNHIFLGACYGSRNSDTETDHTNALYLLYEKENSSKAVEIIRDVLNSTIRWKWSIISSFHKMPAYLIAQLLLNSMSAFSIKDPENRKGINFNFLTRRGEIKTKDCIDVLNLKFEPKESDELILHPSGLTLHCISSVESYIEEKENSNTKPEYKAEQPKAFYYLSTYTAEQITEKYYKAHDGKDFKKSVYCIYPPFNHSKHTVKAFSFKTTGNWRTCRSHWITDSIEIFNSTYKGLAKLNFKTVKAKSHSKMNKIIEKSSKDYQQRIQGRTVEILNHSAADIQNENKDFLLKFLHETVGLNILWATEASGNFPVLEIIEERNYYSDSGKEDPYTIHHNIAWQHITRSLLEDSVSESRLKHEMKEARKRENPKSSKTKINDLIPSVEKSIDELMIKQDIIQNMITLFDWTSYAQKDTYQFGRLVKIHNRKKNADEEHYVIVTVYPDGALEFEFDPDPYEENIFIDTLYLYGANAELILSNGKECMAMIHTNMIPLPNYKKMNVADPVDFPTFDKNKSAAAKREIAKEDTVDKQNASSKKNKYYSKIKSQAKFYEYAPGMIDVNHFTIDKKTHYCAGMLLEAISSYDINYFPNVYCLELVKGRNAYFSKFEELITIPFVRVRQQSVNPFMVKYINEAAIMHYNS
jgi:hypothetical protein